MQNQLINVALLENNTGQIQGIKNNPRTIDASSYAKLKQSLTDYKDMLSLRELLVIPHNNKYVVIAGNQRLRALKELGYKEAYCKVLPTNTPHDFINAVIIKDNVDLGHWDYDMLANEWDEMELIEWGVELPDEWIDNIDDMEDIDSTKEDEVPDIDIKEPITKRGDVWLCGEHRVMCGDSTMIDDVEKLMNGKRADMGFIDPPYNTGMQSNDSTKLNHMFNDKFTDEEWENLLSGFINNLYIALKDNTVAYICLDWRRSHELVPHIKKTFKLSNIIVWDKIVHGLGSDYKYTYELIHVCKKGKPKLNTHQGDADYKDIWHIQRKIGKDEEHATKKPIQIMERAINHATEKKQIVIDLFGGSGSTLIACEKTKRINYSMELDAKYCDVIVKRWQNLTGKQATLEGTDKHFNDFEVK